LVVWVQGKRRGRRYKDLRGLKVSEKVASAAIVNPKGPWRLSSASAMHRAFSNKRFEGYRLFSMEKLAGANPPNRRGTDPVVCVGWHREMPPIPINMGMMHDPRSSPGAAADIPRSGQNPKILG
jgi:hypothetical protein